MSTKAKVLAAYFAVALLAAIYMSIWGASSHQGFFYNLGAGIVWPLVIFPGLGKIIGVMILVAVIAVVVGT